MNFFQFQSDFLASVLKMSGKKKWDMEETIELVDANIIPPDKGSLDRLDNWIFIQLAPVWLPVIKCNKRNNILYWNRIKYGFNDRKSV